MRKFGDAHVCAYSYKRAYSYKLARMHEGAASRSRQHLALCNISLCILIQSSEGSDASSEQSQACVLRLVRHAFFAYSRTDIK